MTPSLPDSTFVAPPPATPSLMHRWFVEYNPSYLFSAALVLAGLTLVSCDLAVSDALAGVGLAAIAEIYALMLIAGAALLVRLGQRRAGVMVGLLAALYQCDLTMHTETNAYLGELGLGLAALWAALFHVKLRLLARALELRPSRSALAVPSLGALGLALLPHLLRALTIEARTSVLALFVFALGALGLWTARTIESAVGYDYRGRRAVRGTWVLWAVAALAHVVYSAVQLRVDLLVLAPIALLLGTRWASRERSVWVACVVALVIGALVVPEQLPVIAVAVSATLLLRAFRRIELTTTTPAPLSQPAPYRNAPMDDAPASATEADLDAPPTFSFSTRAARERLLAGALASAHLAAWTALTTGSLARPHVGWLDLVLVAALALLVARSRGLQPLVPVLGLGVHLGITQGWLRVPHSAAEWGIWSIGSGFVMLGASLTATWWISAKTVAPELHEE